MTLTFVENIGEKNGDKNHLFSKGLPNRYHFLAQPLTNNKQRKGVLGSPSLRNSCPAENPGSRKKLFTLYLFITRKIIKFKLTENLQEILMNNLRCRGW